MALYPNFPDVLDADPSGQITVLTTTMLNAGPVTVDVFGPFSPLLRRNGIDVANGSTFSAGQTLAVRITPSFTAWGSTTVVRIDFAGEVRTFRVRCRAPAKLGPVPAVQTQAVNISGNPVEPNRNTVLTGYWPDGRLSFSRTLSASPSELTSVVEDQVLVFVDPFVRSVFIANRSTTSDFKFDVPYTPIDAVLVRTDPSLNTGHEIYVTFEDSPDIGVYSLAGQLLRTISVPGCHVKRLSMDNNQRLIGVGKVALDGSVGHGLTYLTRTQSEFQVVTVPGPGMEWVVPAGTTMLWAVTGRSGELYRMDTSANVIRTIRYSSIFSGLFRSSDGINVAATVAAYGMIVLVVRDAAIMRDTQSILYTYVSFGITEQLSHFGFTSTAGLMIQAEGGTARAFTMSGSAFGIGSAVTVGTGVRSVISAGGRVFTVRCSPNVAQAGLPTDFSPDPVSIPRIFAPGGETVVTPARVMTNFVGPMFANVSPRDNRVALLVNGNAASLAQPNIHEGDTVSLRIISPANAEDSTENFTVHVGTLDIPVEVVFGWPDVPIDAIRFPDVVDAPVSTVITSETRSISGLGDGIRVRVAVNDGQVLINGVVVTTPAGIQDGDTLALRITSSSQTATRKFVKVTIGSFEEVWTVKTGGYVPTTFIKPQLGGRLFNRIAPNKPASEPLMHTRRLATLGTLSGINYLPMSGSTTQATIGDFAFSVPWTNWLYDLSIATDTGAMRQGRTVSNGHKAKKVIHPTKGAQLLYAAFNAYVIADTRTMQTQTGSPRVQPVGDVHQIAPDMLAASSTGVIDLWQATATDWATAYRTINIAEGACLTDVRGNEACMVVGDVTNHRVHVLQGFELVGSLDLGTFVYNIVESSTDFYAVATGTNLVTRIGKSDPMGDRTSAVMPSGYNQPWAAAYDATGNRLILSALRSKDLLVLDGTTLAVLERIPTTAYAYRMEIVGIRLVLGIAYDVDMAAHNQIVDESSPVEIPSWEALDVHPESDHTTAPFLFPETTTRIEMQLEEFTHARLLKNAQPVSGHRSTFTAGDRLQIQAKATAKPEEVRAVGLFWDGGQSEFLIATDRDRIPNSIYYTVQTGIAPRARVTTEERAVSGLSPSVFINVRLKPITLPNAECSLIVNGVDLNSRIAQVTNGDLVAIRADAVGATYGGMVARYELHYGEEPNLEPFCWFEFSTLFLNGIEVHKPNVPGEPRIGDSQFIADEHSLKSAAAATPIQSPAHAKPEYASSGVDVWEMQAVYAAAATPADVETRSYGLSEKPLPTAWFSGSTVFSLQELLFASKTAPTRGLFDAHKATKALPQTTSASPTSEWGIEADRKQLEVGTDWSLGESKNAAEVETGWASPFQSDKPGVDTRWSKFVSGTRSGVAQYIQHRLTVFHLMVPMPYVEHCRAWPQVDAAYVVHMRLDARLVEAQFQVDERFHRRSEVAVWRVRRKYKHSDEVGTSWMQESPTNSQEVEVDYKRNTKPETRYGDRQFVSVIAVGHRTGPDPQFEIGHATVAVPVSRLSSFTVTPAVTWPEEEYDAQEIRAFTDDDAAIQAGMDAGYDPVWATTLFDGTKFWYTAAEKQRANCPSDSDVDRLRPLFGYIQGG